MTANEIISKLRLEPHPEGGYYRETFRHAGPEGERGAMTSIYFLLREGERSHWHRVDAAEIWHFYAGSSLKVRIVDEDTKREVTLGPALNAGEVPQAVVPPNAWQSAEAGSGWALVGCTVGPAFEFDGFELAPPGFEP